LELIAKHTQNKPWIKYRRNYTNIKT
jgi:hypothetical protein